MKPKISVVVPTLNEGAIIGRLLESLQAARAAGHQLILVDGGSTDDTARRAEGLVDRLLTTSPGRARQMNRGARASAGEWLLFLHADSRLPDGWLAQLEAACIAGDCQWGFHRVRLDNPAWPYRLIGWSMNRRSCLTGIGTGDQGIFVRRRLFFSVKGFPEIPLMEDVALSRRLRRLQRPRCLSGPLVTSARRWEVNGVGSTMLRMWALRLAFFLGVSPWRLRRHYSLCSSPEAES